MCVAQHSLEAGGSSCLCSMSDSHCSRTHFPAQVPGMGRPVLSCHAYLLPQCLLCKTVCAVLTSCSLLYTQVVPDGSVCAALFGRRLSMLGMLLQTQLEMCRCNPVFDRPSSNPTLLSLHQCLQFATCLLLCQIAAGTLIAASDSLV